MKSTSLQRCQAEWYCVDVSTGQDR